MSEIHNDNPETKSSAPEVSQPEPAKASEGDKEKLTPQENDAAKSNRDNNENKKDTDSPEHPKLENNENANQPQVEEKNNTERPEHGKLSPSDPGSATNPEQHPNSEDDEPKKDEGDQPKKSEDDEPKKDEDDQPKKSENDESKRNESDDPKANELSPYAKEKLDNFPKDAPEEIKPAYERACAAEPKITNDMKDVTANAPGAHLEGLDYRLKDGDSFARKANSVSENKGIPLEDAANNMHDLNRYTQVSDGDHLVDNANNTLAGLKDKGYTINDVNSTWGDDGAYKGINCKLTSPDGQPCELQFHTPESLDTKEPMHKLYEAQRQLPEGSPEWNAYEDQMRNMSSSLTPPKNIDNLRTNYD